VAIVTTYVCDVSGVTGQDKKDFVEVRIEADLNKSIYERVTINKLVHRDVALKLNLVKPQGTEVKHPEPTFESKLTTLLTDYLNDLVYDEVSNQLSNRN
jgi:hypothetical protein